MAYRMTRAMAASPAAVLAAILQALGTGFPGDPPLRRPKGVRGVAGRVKGDRFTIGLVQLSDGDPTDMVGMVVAAEGGGSEVRASVVDDRNAGAEVLILLVIVAGVGLAGGGIAWWLLAIAAVVGTVTAIRRAAGAINHQHAAFLLHWLNAVLDGVESSSGAAPANDPAHPGIPT